MDRDLNASINIKNYYLNTVSSTEINAYGESVRLLSNKSLSSCLDEVRIKQETLIC